jgi:DNA-binding SARP family transcriptional activator
MPEINDYSFRLFTFDSPRMEICEVGSDAPRIVGPGKNLAILAYLALSPGRSATRDRLCDLLWGDRDLSRSRPQLRQTLWLIRSQIGPDIVIPAKDRLSLNPRIGVDVEDFLAAIRENNFHRALQIYEGDFFSAFASPGSGNFEEWASLERTRLRRMFVSCAESVMRAALDAGHFGHALEIAKRVRQLEPDGQTGWRMLIESRIASGDRIGAEGDANQLEEWLAREEWKAEPATRAILHVAK